MADLLRQRGERMQWYRDELLHMAKELGHRLLPAFNTTSGLPYPKVVLILLLNITNLIADSLYASKLGTNKQQTCSSFCTVTDIIFAVFGSPGKSALRCPKPTFPDRHRVRHLHSMCRNNDPGIRCPQQAVRKLCV